MKVTAATNTLSKSAEVAELRMPTAVRMPPRRETLRIAGENLSSKAKSPNASSATRVSGRGLKKRELLMLVTQLSIMLRSGVDLADAVRSVHLRTSSPTIREAMGELYSALESGQSLSAAVHEQRHRFGGVMAATVSAGEAAGRLPEVMGRLAAILRDELRLQSALQSAVSYPLVLVLVTSGVLGAMIFFVLPQFADIYASSQAPTPALTRFLLDSASTIRAYWWALGAIAVAGVAGLIMAFRSASGRLLVDRGMLNLPMFRRVWRPLLAGRMFRLQGAMLQSGVPMLEVLQLTRDATRNSQFHLMIDSIEDSVMQGLGMAVCLTDSPCMPEGAAEMIATAEANGQLGSVLETVGEFFEAEGEQQLRDVVKIAEPAIIVALGLVVGSIVLAVMLPLLDLSAASGSR